jgi:hypothetical protein
MKLFKCDHCSQPVYFENYFCVQCNAVLGFDPVQMDMLSLQTMQDDSYVPYKEDTTTKYKYCLNKQYAVCNWLIPADSDSAYCTACNLNHTIPNLEEAGHKEKWARIEAAKHRLVYSLLRFRLPVISKLQDEDNGVAFDFMAEEKNDEGQRLLTGHDNGLITLNIEEADDVARVMARQQMDEVYRTLLGHFRHEIGHYYWDRLVRDTDRLQAFRNIFGDESADYAEALKQHYGKKNSDAWKENFISAYANAHPWEDWAETWAHYMHIVDTLETAYSFGMILRPKVTNADNELSAALNIDPYVTKYFDDIFERWLPLSFAMNSLNRSMGMKDSYPFVITEAVKEKLDFIHETIRAKPLNS